MENFMILRQGWWFRKKTEVEDFILIIFCFLIFSVACCIVTLCIAISIPLMAIPFAIISAWRLIPISSSIRGCSPMWSMRTCMGLNAITMRLMAANGIGVSSSVVVTVCILRVAAIII